VSRSNEGARSETYKIKSLEAELAEKCNGLDEAHRMMDKGLLRNTEAWFEKETRRQQMERLVETARHSLSSSDDAARLPQTRPSEFDTYDPHHDHPLLPDAVAQALNLTEYKSLVVTETGMKLHKIGCSYTKCRETWCSDGRHTMPPRLVTLCQECFPDLKMHVGHL